MTPLEQALARLHDARRRGDEIAIVSTAAATVIVVASRPSTGDAELLQLEDAARAAATSKRVLRESIRRGELAAFGRERDRSVRRSDLLAWIDRRRVTIDGDADGADVGADIDRRVRRRRAEAAQ